jgi:hypothetical protein
MLSSEQYLLERPSLLKVPTPRNALLTATNI